jgi:hypothetical protein
MKRPPDPLTLGTKTPQSTGEKMKADIDDEIKFDADLSEFCVNDDDDDTHNGILEPLADSSKHSHDSLINRANVNAKKLVQPIVASEASLIDSSDDDTPLPQKTQQALHSLPNAQISMLHPCL